MSEQDDSERVGELLSDSALRLMPISPEDSVSSKSAHSSAAYASNEIQRCVQSERRLEWLEFLSGAVPVVAVALLSARAYDGPMLLKAGLFLALLVMPGILIFAALHNLWDRAWTQRRADTERAVGDAARSKRTESVGALLEGLLHLDYGLYESRYAVRRGLVMSLLRLKAGDAWHLTHRQRQCALRLLESHTAFIFSSGSDSQDRGARMLNPFDASLSIAILNLYRFLPDSDALPLVEKLAASSQAESLDEASEVRNAAAAVLPYLRVNIKRQGARRTSQLLTPAVGPEDSVLVRAADSNFDIDESLLRPVDQSEQGHTYEKRSFQEIDVQINGDSSPSSRKGTPGI